MRALSNPQSSVKYSHPQESLPDMDLIEEESDLEEGQMPEPSPVSKHSFLVSNYSTIIHNPLLT